MSLFHGVHPKKISAPALVLTLLFAALAGSFFINLATADPLLGSKSLYYKFSILSPKNETTPEHITLKFIVKTNWAASHLSFCFALDTSGEVLYGAVWNNLLKVKESIVSQVEISNDSTSSGFTYNPYIETTYECIATLPPLSYGEHSITIYRGFNFVNPTAIYSNLYRFCFNVAKPPQVSLAIPQNQTSYLSDVPLTFRVFVHSLSWVGYSLDGGKNVTVGGDGLVQSAFGPFAAWDGHLMLDGLSCGGHSLVVYAEDASGRLGVSEVVAFSISENLPSTVSYSNSLLAAVVFIVIIAFVALASFGLVAYFVKRNRKRRYK
jgi:hypothetical protein